MTNKKLLYLGLPLFFGTILVIWTNFNQTLETQSQMENPSPNPLDSSFPFQEMTIPYLQKQPYQSSLGNLELYEQKELYTSYFTHYNSNNLKINALLTKPKGEMPQGGWPGIVFVHGYIPPKEYKTNEKYVDYVDYLAANGFVVFKIDLRGHGDSQGQANGAYYSSDYIVDTLNAYAALQSADFIHPQKVGLWGHSMAGNVILRTMAVKKDIPAAVIWAGAVYTYQDLSDYGISDASYQMPSGESPQSRRRRELFSIHGQFDAESEFWQKVIPINYLNGVQTKLQIHHALDDSVVSINYSRNLDKILDGKQISHQIYEYSSGGHNINGANFNDAMAQTTAFFKQILQ